MRGNSNTAIELLGASRVEAIRDALSDNEEFCSCMKKIDDRLNELHKIVPKESRDALYKIESALSDIITISIDLTYKQGFHGINLVKLARANRKPKYIVMEFESHRKDVVKLYGGRTGWLYKLTKVLREYTDEAEVDQDMAKLKSGEITEDDIIRKRKNV
jgi:hypothetical protein